MEGACSPSRPLGLHGFTGLCAAGGSSVAEATLLLCRQDAFELMGCECVANNLMDCVASDLYDCHRASMVGAMDCASCIDSDALANDSGYASRTLDNLSLGSSGGMSSMVNDADHTKSATDDTVIRPDSMGPGLLALPALQLPPGLQHEALHKLPPLHTVILGRADSVQSELEQQYKFGSADCMAGSDDEGGWSGQPGSPQSPAACAAALSAASSRASLSTMVPIGSGGSGTSPCAGHQQPDACQGTDTALAAERQGSTASVLPAAAYVQPLASCQAAATHATDSPVEASREHPSEVELERAAIPNRRTAAAVNALLAAHAKKRGPAVKHTGKLAPPPAPGHSCTACGATSTPVWRAGPYGRKSLCNACGVRYMKVAKKK